MSTRRSLVLVGAAMAVLASLTVAPGAAAHDETCSTQTPGGGEWPVFGGDLEGTRDQKAEKSMRPFVVPAWTFDANYWTEGTNNEITGYPVLAGGCLFVGSSTGNDADGQHLPGWVFAINADTGKLVWKAQVEGGVYSTLAVDGDLVYAFVSRIGSPYVVALDRTDGHEVWRRTVDNQPGSDAVSSPVPYDGMLWVGVSGTAAEGDEADRHAFQGSSVLLATDDTHGFAPGQIVRKIHTIPETDWDQGYAGGAQWGTISIDSASGFGYVGTGNPFNYDAEHDNTNAVLKLDLRWGSPTFGTIHGSYKGDVEEFFPGADGGPVCDEAESLSGVFAAGFECLNLDLDFGAAPTIYTDAAGTRIVAAGQKSGVVHFIDADTMQPVKKVPVGVPSAVGGIVGSTAYDGVNIYGPHTIGGYLWAIDAHTRDVRWVSPTADGVHWGPPVTHANGVLWTVDLKGFLDGYDARTGLLLQHLPMSVGTQTYEDPALSWGGVTVARRMVFASVGIGATSADLPSAPNGFVLAFRRLGSIA